MKKFIEKSFISVVFAMIGFFIMLWCAIEVEGVFGVELLIRLLSRGMAESIGNLRTKQIQELHQLLAVSQKSVQ